MKNATLLGILIGLAPGFVIALTGEESYSRTDTLELDAAICFVFTLVAGGIIASGTKQRPKSLPMICFLAFLFSLGFMAVNAAVVCAGCTFQVISHLN